jgi:hypothetical protein
MIEWLDKHATMIGMGETPSWQFGLPMHSRFCVTDITIAGLPAALGEKCTMDCFVYVQIRCQLMCMAAFVDITTISFGLGDARPPITNIACAIAGARYISPSKKVYDTMLDAVCHARGQWVIMLDSTDRYSDQWVGLCSTHVVRQCKAAWLASSCKRLKAWVTTTLSAEECTIYFDLSCTVQNILADYLAVDSTALDMTWTDPFGAD